MKSVLVGALLFLSGSLATQAAITGYTSEAAYEAAVGDRLFAIGFEGLEPALGDGLFAGRVDFGSPEASDPTQVFFNSGAMTDAGSTTAASSVGPIDGRFASPVFAFRMHFSSSANPQTVFAFDSADAMLGSAVSNPAGFFGIVSDTAMARFLIANGEFSVGNRDRFFLDDFAVNAPIPEPDVYLMLLAGLALVGLAARQRQRKLIA
jgi:hypothetical protein